VRRRGRLSVPKRGERSPDRVVIGGVH